MDNFILISSGFIIPENNYFKLFKPNEDTVRSIFSRSVVTSNDAKIVEFYKNKNVYHSDTIDKLLDTYQENKDFENFIAIVNVSTEIFKKIDFLGFFKLQLTNTNLSNISHKFCLDCVSGKFFTNYHDYSIVPFNIRFTYNNAITTDKVVENLNKLEKEVCSINNWEEFFISLYETSRDSFITFFRYIFADYY